MISGDTIEYKLPDLHELIFGDKRIVLVEQLSCKKYNDIVKKLQKKNLTEMLERVSKKISMSTSAPANWVVVSPTVARELNDMSYEEYRDNLPGNYEVDM